MEYSRNILKVRPDPKNKGCVYGTLIEHWFCFLLALGSIPGGYPVNLFLEELREERTLPTI